jgi:hypothetical protein
MYSYSSEQTYMCLLWVHKSLNLDNMSCIPVVSIYYAPLVGLMPKSVSESQARILFVLMWNVQIFSDYLYPKFVVIDTSCEKNKHDYIHLLIRIP